MELCHYAHTMYIYVICFRFNQMFGTLGILDRIHGTDALFRKNKAHERHFLLVGLTPANELIPDEPKKGSGDGVISHGPRPSIACDRIKLLSKRKDSCLINDNTTTTARTAGIQ